MPSMQKYSRVHSTLRPRQPSPFWISPKGVLHITVLRADILRKLLQDWSLCNHCTLYGVRGRILASSHSPLAHKNTIELAMAGIKHNDAECASIVFGIIAPVLGLIGVGLSCL